MDNSDVYAMIHEHETDEKHIHLISETIKHISLTHGDLLGAEFYSCIFDGVYFENVNFNCARFDDCLFVNCVFTNVTFIDAIIMSSFFTECSFMNSNLDRAKVHDFGYSGLLMRNSKCSHIRMACPEEGSFIAWKKVAYAVPICQLHEYGTGIKFALVKLQIPAEAKRSSAGSRKCRCEYADVLDIEDIETGRKMNCVNNYERPILYIKGERVTPDSFDPDRWNECSHGIHFFMSKQDALEYQIY